MQVTALRTEKRQGWREYTATFLSCGHVTDEAAADGAIVECKECDQEAQARVKIAEAHRAGRLSHTRMSRMGCKAIDAYVRDDSSPTGVLHLARLNDTPENYTFLRSLDAHLSPLSRAEPL